MKREICPWCGDEMNKGNEIKQQVNAEPVKVAGICNKTKNVVH